uniref:PX domain-containing protein n=1 Tax=Rhabditophanes sp. KR3021 TaxID=114890 RepID=A0AC35TJ35_9BILA
MPGKKYWGNMSEGFIETRLAELQKFLNNLSKYPYIYGHRAVAEFFGLQSQLMGDFKYWALVLTSKASGFIDGDTWFQNGWRGNKLNYLLTSKATSSILSFLPYGPDSWRFRKISDTRAALNVLSKLNSTYISQASSVWVDEKGVSTINELSKDGSLRDKMYQTRSYDDFLYKYGHENWGSLDVGMVKLYGKQILDALIMLNKLNYPFVDVHCGNLWVKDGFIQIGDVEFTVCGHSSMLRQEMLKSKLVKSLQDMMVFSFGTCMYEMLGGRLMYSEEESLDVVPDDGLTIIESIFSPHGSQLPTLQQLFDHSFFSDVSFQQSNVTDIELTETEKSVLSKMTNNLETRFAVEKTLLEEFFSNGHPSQVINQTTSFLKANEMLRINHMKLLPKSGIELTNTQNIIPSEDHKVINPMTSTNQSEGLTVDS